MKLLLSTLVLFALLVGEHLALDAESYATHLDALIRNETFLDEYAEWAFKLFSKPDYLYGDSHRRFPCPIAARNSSRNVSVSVHSLRPSDVKCVAALGDSFVTGLAAHAITPSELLVENRGISWAIGGDYMFSKVLSLPNILRQYNPKLEGFSEQTSLTKSNDQNGTRNRLNLAESGDHSADLIDQAEQLIARLKNENICDWNDDWKVITVFVGTNNLCSSCDTTDQSVNREIANVRDALDKLYNASIPRTLVNLVPGRDVRGVGELSNSGYVCQALAKKLCPCLSSWKSEQGKLLDDYISQHKKVLYNLIRSGRYEKRDDFTVVIQPFLVETPLPLTEEDEIDFSYFAPDCFHFSGKGHAQAALSLWNNMLEPVGGKKHSWHLGEPLKCPTEEYPFIFTSKNSAQVMVARRNTTITQTTPRTSTVITSTTTIDSVVNSTIRHHKKHKTASPKLDSFSNKSTYLILTGLLLIALLLIVVIAVKRQSIRLIISGGRQGRFERFDNSRDLDEMDEVEVWSHPQTKPSRSDRPQTTETHGARLTFE